MYWAHGEMTAQKYNDVFEGRREALIQEIKFFKKKMVFMNNNVPLNVESYWISEYN